MNIKSCFEPLQNNIKISIGEHEVGIAYDCKFNNIRYFICKLHDCINNVISDIEIPIDVFKSSDKNLPKHIYVTDKATVFQYGSKDDKLILYRKEEDSMDLASAFMWAYTIRTLKISKTQMHKFMNSLENIVTKNSRSNNAEYKPSKRVTQKIDCEFKKLQDELESQNKKDVNSIQKWMKKLEEIENERK